MVRGGLHVQHRTLYREGLYRTASGWLHSGFQLLKLINFGMRDGLRKFYTYVVISDRFRFSESGAELQVDIWSKHALHANCSREVVYAGEFLIRYGNEGHQLVIDNNSGTYGPDKADLPKLEKIFHLNFPDLHVLALDREDPLWHQYRSELNEHNE